MLNRRCTAAGQRLVKPEAAVPSRGSLETVISGLLKLNPMARHRAHCEHVRAQMSDYLDGELDERTVRSIERHVRWCPNCRRMLENLRRTVGGLNAIGELRRRRETGSA